MMNTLFAAVLMICATAGPAEGYSNDDLCRAIGDTPQMALQPRDRLFFEKKCSCVNVPDAEADGPGVLMCFAKGSKLHKAAQARANEAGRKKAAVLERRRAVAEREREATAAKERQRLKEIAERDAKQPALEAAFATACRAHQACMETKPPDECTRETMPAFKAACDSAGKEGFSPFACRYPENKACLW